MTEQKMQNLLGIYFLVSSALFLIFLGGVGVLYCILNVFGILMVMGIFYLHTEGISFFFTPEQPTSDNNHNSTNSALKFKDQHPILTAIIVDRVTTYCAEKYGFSLTRGELNGIIVAVNQIRSSDVEYIIQFAKDHPFIFMHLVMNISENYMEHKKRGTELKPQQIAALIIAFNYFR